jgi:DNA-binding NarL/FixJ family response regulator
LEPKRILLVGLPRLLEQIVAEALVGAEDLALVGISSKLDDLSGAAEEARADVVVLRGADRAQVMTLLEQHPRLAVLSIDGDGRDSSLCALRPECIRIVDVSPTSLVAAIRDVMQSGARSWGR